ncbi:TonB-dependent receptor [Tenacibaculum holothuriorum]|uniref:TonB-dependent receptor n=1 Tax=Tenacibaculum holothuriorum TaxID=1635173 RepID=A0A1Y2PAR4_9FLAO|nr:TonB-dependent receptor [Tenacibaculum holothuriorum]OSY87111.1 TonB-dependent receptor [Tenacibaculum holothuriorum]
MKRVLLAMFLLITLAITAQKSQISGKVLDNNNNPLVGVNVILKNSKIGTQTDIDGNFEISNLTEGKQESIVISYVGFKTQTVAITVPQQNISITLFEGNELLQEVIVDTNRKNKFSRKKTAYVAKLPLRSIENSQVYSTITNQLLVSQNVTNFSDALKNAVGVDQLWPSTGRSGDGAGYYSVRGFSVQPQLVNGMPGITNGFINPSNVERVEVIKGPSATLFGSTVTSYGGLINIVTKKPYKGTGGNITVGAGSFGFKKLTADINTTDESQKFSLRLNAGFQSEDSFQDAGFRKSHFIAPAISYQANDKLTFNLSYELSSTDQTNQVFLFLNRAAPLTFKNITELNYNTDLSLTNDDVSIKNPTQNYRGEIAYKITDNWSSQTIIAGGNAKSQGYYTYLYNLRANMFGLYAQNTNAETNTFNLQQNFTGDFKIGTIRNRLVVGVDYLKSQTIDNSSNWRGIHVVNPQGQVIPVPANFGFANLPINKANINSVLASAGNVNTDVNQNIFGAYISDVVNILPELSVMAGVRYDRFNYKGDENNPLDDATAYTKSTLSPKFGVVYQPILNKVSVFANYQNGFSYVNPELTLIDPNNPAVGTQLLSFDLERANQFETGIKTNLFNNKLETTISYYNILVSDKIIGFGPSKVQDGKVKSQGIEIEANANPIDGLNVRGGFSYNDSKVLESASNPAIIGNRFGEAGAKFNYNFWADYKFGQGTLKNFGISGGFNGASDFNTMENYPISGEFILPAYTVFNAAVFYENNTIRASVNVNNLTNETYYKGWSTVTPQQPRAIYGALTYKF